ncbi:YjbH domain-containing protein [Aestuariibius sp. HNIBRBA575]|uniref:YjbH domain-containing protein n=1 Tax=Aestuariibius sp. HNIBRBA575 TaxID=3233343 RepID=UPI0034A50652
MPGHVHAEQLSLYGTPGLADLPTAMVLEDGNLALTSGYFGNNLRHSLTFQITPRTYGVFRYSIIDDIDEFADTRWDRSFDLHFLLAEETSNRPAIAVGLRDFGGTGIYSSEYLVATKHVSPRLTVTGGLGWGRLANRGGFDSPLSWFSDYFATRPDPRAGDNDQTGQLDAGSWFRGDVALFGGLEWQATDRLNLFVEYSPDLYLNERQFNDMPEPGPINLGASYAFENGFSLGAYYMQGTDLGLRLSYQLDPAQPRVPGGLDSAPVPLAPLSSVAAASWNQPGASPNALQDQVAAQLTAEGLHFMGLHITGNTARLIMRNDTYQAEAQALGRAARVLANTLPPHVSQFDITFVVQGMAQTNVTLTRADLSELEFDLQGDWLSQSRAQFSDAHGTTPDFNGSEFDWSLTPYTAFSLFEPQTPVRGDFGLQLHARYSPNPGLVFSGLMRQPLWGNIDGSNRLSNSVIQHVRSDALRYAQESDLEINYLTAEYFTRLGQDMFGRVTVGYLENMYGGVSGEMLWFPVNSRLAAGVELNYAVQRDFDMLFGFQDYDVLTGHASVYYDLGNDFHAQLDVGRYLAGDYGATLSLDREFNNGFKVGAFMTLTDVPFTDFGEGSFDKGIRIEIPNSWLSGEPSRDARISVIRPVVRDGGARLNVNNRLYGVVRDYRQPELTDQWGRFFR